MARALGTQSTQISPSGSPWLHGRRVPRVVITIATYRRPVMLRSLLESIRALDTSPHLYWLRAVIVADNDAEQSARTIVAEIAGVYPCDLIYACAPERNIAVARNLGVHHALELGSEFIAFTDDDCTVAPDWLTELATIAREHHADVVAGTLRHTYPVGTPRWIRDGGFFDLPVAPTGTVLSVAHSNNALVRASLLRSMREPFDPTFGISGGSDSLLFIRLRHAGARIVQAASAVVTESIPASRTSLRWIMQRAYRMGNAGVFTYRAALPMLHWLPGRVVKSGGHMLIGAFTALTGLVRGRSTVMRGLRRMALATGIIGALLGHRYFEYRNVHGE